MADLSWGIAVPFREDPDPRIHRGRLLQVVLDHLGDIAPIALIDSDPDKPFNRAGARNNSVRHAEAQGWEVVVILDADTLPPLALLRSAVKAAATGGIHQPFQFCVTLDPDLGLTPDSLDRSHLNRTVAQRVWMSPGSCYILRPDVYWAAGGQDEGFINWGGEDSAFIAAARALGIPVQHHPVGQRRRNDPTVVAVQLHHGQAEDRRKHPSYPDTKRRQSIYERLIRSPQLMQEWIKERHEPDAEKVWAAPNHRGARNRGRG